MAKVNMFENFNIGNLNTYKDDKYKQQTDATKAAFNHTNVYIIPKQIYDHLTKYSGFIFDHIQDYLSYEDIAKLLKVNDIFNYDPIARLTIYNTLPEQHKINVDCILKTPDFIKSVDNYLYDEASDDAYSIKNIENTIVVIINNGICSKLRNREYKTEFLKNLIVVSYNVMGDGNTNAQPFFKEFVDVL